MGEMYIRFIPFLRSTHVENCFTRHKSVNASIIIHVQGHLTVSERGEKMKRKAVFGKLLTLPFDVHGGVEI